MIEKKKFYFVLVLTIILMGAWAYFIYMPHIEAINDEKNKLNEITTKINTVSEVSKKIESVEQQLNKLSTELSDLESKFLDISEINNLTKIFQNEFSRYNLKITNFSPVVSYFMDITKNDTKNKYIYRLPLEMNLEGSFLDFGRLMENINSLPFFLGPDGVSMSVSKESSSILLINFKTSIYVKSGT